MRRKQETDPLKKKQTLKQQSIDYSFDTQIAILLPYLKIMPITMQSKFLLTLKQIIQKQSISQTHKAYIEKLILNLSNQVVDIEKQRYIFELFCHFLKLNKIRQYSATLCKRNTSRDKQQQPINKKSNNNIQLIPFQPTIYKSSTKFQQMPQIMNQNYQNIIKMYKTFTQIHVGLQYKIKQLNQNYTFYAQSRFIQKLLQMNDFQSEFCQKGNIIMLNFQGNKIIGKRGFAFVYANAVYWWEKNYKDVKDLLPEDKQKQDKDTNRRRQVQKQQNNNIKNEDHQVPKFNQNFKLSYKIVGHQGKITSLALSNDQYYLISAGTDRTIKLWCLRQKCLLAEYRGHMKTIWTVSFNKSGYFFLSGSADKTVKLWSTDDSIPQRVYIGHQDDVTKVDFLRNPDLMASASEDKTIRIWNTLTTQCINILKLDRSPINFKNSISGRYFASCDSSGKLTFYDLLKGQTLSSFKIPQKQQPNSIKTKYLKIHDICFSMDQKQFSCISSKYIIIYSLDKILQKQSKNFYTQCNKTSIQQTVATKQVIFTGRDCNLVYCEYHDKGVLLVASTTTKKY